MRALREAYRLLKPGGMIGVLEPQKGGDWYGGPYREAMEQLNLLNIQSWSDGGGDPFIGRRLPALLREAGFERARMSLAYSPALSSVKDFGEFSLRRLHEPEYRARAVARGWVGPERLDRIAEEITWWMESEDSVVGLAECTAVAWKA